MGKRITIIQGHPDPAQARLCHAIAWAYEEGAKPATRAKWLAEARRLGNDAR